MTERDLAVDRLLSAAVVHWVDDGDVSTADYLFGRAQRIFKMTDYEFGMAYAEEES